MKLMTYAEFVTQPEGTVFEYEFGPSHRTPGLHRKGKTWPGEDEDGPGVTTVNLSYAVERGEEVNEFLSEDAGEDHLFRVYGPADLDRLAQLIGRGRTAR